MPLEAGPDVKHETAEADVRPPLAALFRQLADDARVFAVAETQFVKARIGDGWGYAKPGLIAIGVAIALALGVFIALPIGLMLALAPMIGLIWAVLAVTGGGALLAALMIKFGAGRLKASLKLPEDR